MLVVAHARVLGVMPVTLPSTLRRRRMVGLSVRIDDDIFVKFVRGALSWGTLVAERKMPQAC